MNDYFEIDFLDVASKKSGDAIALRYRRNGVTQIHVVDGGYQATGEKLVEHIDAYYDAPETINAVVVTHPDGDHGGGIIRILEEFNVEGLWMLRPWLYAEELIVRFPRFSNVENLRRRLREAYPTIAKLEEVAIAEKVPILEPFQGASIGAFHVLAPSRERYLDLIVQSEKTPESGESVAKVSFFELIEKAAKVALRQVRSVWGHEIFSSEETSAENEMSVIQLLAMCEAPTLLTGDSGRGGLTEAGDYLEGLGFSLLGIKFFQVPHHGSRRNVSTEVLDRWLGKRMRECASNGERRFTAVVSASKEDADHPRKAVIRAMIHRCGEVLSVENGGISIGRNRPERDGWTPAKPLSYPEEQEAD